MQDRGWSRNAIDEGVRDGLRLDSTEARNFTRNLSDGIFYGMLAYPLAVDVLLVAGPRSGDVAWQLSMVTAESMSVSGLASVAVERSSGRKRPFVRDCAADPSCA